MSIHKHITKSGKYSSAKGTFYPLHKEKFQGESDPKFKSRLEQKMMVWLDKSPHVLKWNYERVIIPYIDKTRGNSTHNYYMDFKTVLNTKNGPKTFIIEVKSHKETIPPMASKRKKKETYKMEVETWIRNQCKWDAASRSARARGWEFKIFTEKELI